MVNLRKIPRRLRDLKDFVDEYVDFSDEPVVGLIPIGDTGLYRTPDEPADPQDCDRYPDSPFCGSNPFTLTPVGLEPQIIIGDCDIGVRLSPVLGFIRLPPVNLVYRKPECRNIKPAFIPAEGNFHLPVPIPERTNRHDHCFTVLLNTFNHRKVLGIILDVYHTVNYERKITRKIINHNTFIVKDLPYEDKVNYIRAFENIVDDPLNLLFFRLDFDETIEESYNQAFLDVNVRPRISNPDRNYYTKETNKRSLIAPAIQDIDFNDDGIESIFGSGSMDSNGILTPLSVRYVIWVDSENASVIDLKLFNNFRYITDVDPLDPSTNYFNLMEAHYEVISTCAIVPPPPPKEICCMPQCCPPPNNDLLKVLIKKVNKLSEIIGVDEYPATLPASLISKDEGFLGNLIPNAPKEIKHLTTFLAWYVERFDEIMGQWEIPIEVKDSDPTTPGDQPKGIKLPNIAEAIAELFTLSLQTNINSEVLLNAQIRDLIEGAADKQQNFIR